MTSTEAPVLTPVQEEHVSLLPSADDKSWYYVFCNQSEKAVYVRKPDQCPAQRIVGDCGCKLLFRLEGESTGNRLMPFDFRDIKAVPEVNDIVATCEGDCIKVLSIEWL